MLLILKFVLSMLHPLLVYEVSKGCSMLKTILRISND